MVSAAAARMAAATTEQYKQCVEDTAGVSVSVSPRTVQDCSYLHGAAALLVQDQLPPRLFTVGRLDVATSGLIFLTNDGQSQAQAQAQSQPQPQSQALELWLAVAGCNSICLCYLLMTSTSCCCCCCAHR
jgi:hypothetical protein